MEKASTRQGKLELVGSKNTGKDKLDPATINTCRILAKWIIAKTDLSFTTREGSLAYIREEIEREEEIEITSDEFNHAAYVLMQRKIMSGSKSSENLTRNNTFTLHPEILVADKQIASEGLKKAVNDLGNDGNHDPVHTTAA